MKNMIISASSLDELSLCPTLFYYDKVLELRLKESQNNTSMEMGSLFHTLLEFLYTMKFRKILPLHEIILRGKDFGRFYGSSDKFKALPEENIEIVVKTFEEYALFYKNENYVTDELENNQPACEVPFTKLIHEDQNKQLRIYIEGAIDWMITNSDLKFVVDHKLGKSDRIDHKLTNQFQCYSWVTGRKYLTVNKVNYTAKKDELKFKRIPYEYPERLIEVWEKSVISHALATHEHAEKGYFPPNFRSCETKYGKCSFLNVCSQEPMYRPGILEMDYEAKGKFNVMKDRVPIEKLLENLGIKVA